MIPLQYKRKKPDKGKESHVQATMDTESISIYESFIQRKRGFTLCKHHCIEFDRMYRQKDLIVQPYSSKVIESNAHGTEKQPLSTNLNFGNKIALKSVKSDKKLQKFRGQTNSAPCRVSIGSCSKKTRFEDQMVSYNESTYGKSEKVKGKEIKFAENCFEYGLVRKK